MARGDQIFVMRPLIGLTEVYEHHGIDCGDGTVIHYQKTDDTPTIRRTSMETFAAGSPIYLKAQPVSYITDVVLERAQSRLGEQQYNLLHNNCEHFATWCKTGRNTSAQIDDAVAGNRLPIGLVTNRTEPPDVLLKRAQGNLSVANAQLQRDYDAALKDMNTWDAAARLALKRNREDLARAALERKVTAKRKVNHLKTQLEEVLTLKHSVEQSQAALVQI